MVRAARMPRAWPSDGAWAQERPRATAASTSAAAPSACMTVPSMPPHAAALVRRAGGTPSTSWSRQPARACQPTSMRPVQNQNHPRRAASSNASAGSWSLAHARAASRLSTSASSSANETVGATPAPRSAPRARSSAHPACRRRTASASPAPASRSPAYSSSVWSIEKRLPPGPGATMTRDLSTRRDSNWARSSTSMPAPAHTASMASSGAGLAKTLSRPNRSCSAGSRRS